MIVSPVRYKFGIRNPEPLVKRNWLIAVVTTGSPRGVAEVIEVNVRSEQCGTLAVTAVDDLEEQRGMFRVVLLKPVKA